MNVRFADNYGFELNAWETLPLVITTKQCIELLVDDNYKSLPNVIGSFTNACIDELVERKIIGDAVKDWDLYTREVNDKVSLRMQDYISVKTRMLTEQHGVEYTEMIAEGYIPIGDNDDETTEA